MPTLRWLAATLLLLIICAEARADACFPLNMFRRRPQPWEGVPVPTKEHELVIVRDPSAKIAELRIPKAMMVADASPRGSTRHAMAGIALSAAFVGGGLWCLRYKAGQMPKKKVIVGVSLGFLLLSLVTSVEFVGATPPKKSPEMMRLMQMNTIGDVEVTVTVVDGGERIELIVPPQIADKIEGK